MKHFFIFFITGCLFVNNAYPQSSFKNEFGFQTDNDAYLALQQDRYYTNGLFVTFRHATDQSRLRRSVNKKIWDIEFGHQIYNPITGSITDIKNIDRPFAAYLYVGGGLNWFYNSENSLKLSVRLSTMGPSALGKEVQETLHDMAGFYPVKGWDYQVHDEKGINTTLAYNHFLYRNKAENTDFMLTSYLNAGNTFTGTGAGILFRTGAISPFSNSVSTNSIIANNQGSESSRHKKELFFFLKPSLHLVAYDATIQGGMFVKDKGPITYDIKPVVFSQEVGVNYATSRWTLNFGVTFKSKEVESPAKGHKYGSATFYYRFN